MLAALTRAHVVPKSVGGRLETLVCRECDSRCGSSFDRHAADEHKLNGWLRGEQTLPAKVACGDAVLTADCRFDGKAFTFEYLASKSTPRAMEDIAAAWGTVSLKVQVPGFNRKRLARSLIYSAYLMLFRQLGYEYVLSKPAAWVRGIVRAPDDAEPPSKILIATRDLGGDFDLASVPSVSIVKAPRELACFVIALPNPVPGAAPRCVLLPGFGEAGAKAFENVLALDTAPRLTLTLLPKWPRGFLADLANKGFFHWLWWRITQSESGTSPRAG